MLIFTVDRQPCDARRRAVQRVTHDRVPQRLHVHADLVGAARLDAQVQQRKVARGGVQAFQHGVVRARRAGIVGPPACGRLRLVRVAQAGRAVAGGRHVLVGRARGHAGAANAVARNGQIDQSAIALYGAVDECQVVLFQRSL